MVALSVTPLCSSCCAFSNFAVPYTPLSFMLPWSGVFT